MKTSTIKNAAIIVLATIGFSVTAQAAEQQSSSNIESTQHIVEKIVAVQAQQMMNELSNNLQQSITEQLQAFNLETLLASGNDDQHETQQAIVNSNNTQSTKQTLMTEE